MQTNSPSNGEDRLKTQSTGANTPDISAYTDTSWERPGMRVFFLALAPVLFAIPIAIFFFVFLFPFGPHGEPVADIFGSDGRIIVYLILLGETAGFWKGGWTALRHAFKKGTPELNILAAKGDTEGIKAKLTASRSMEQRDQYGNTPLHIAAFRGDLATVRDLLAAGANVNARDNLGETPLHKATPGNHVEVVAALLAAGADLDAKDKNGGTPLHQAAATSGVAGVSKLLEAGANKDATIPKYMLTPLHLAAAGGRLQAAKLLVAAGANKELRTYEGKTARDIALAKGHRDIAAILE